MTVAATRIAKPSVTVDVIVESDAWSACTDAERIVRQAIETAAGAVGRSGEVAVMLTDDASIRVMNARWRGIDKPTNVLSFPSGESQAAASTHLGDIAIAFETVKSESITENKTLADHLAHLAVHGYLHLVGFDHETDAEAATMESLETRILAGLGIPDPYTDRTPAD